MIIRRLIGVVLVLLVLLVVIDRVTWWAARRVVAERVQSEAGLAERPEVEVHGFPLLTQALRGEYDQVNAKVDDLSVQDGVTVDELDVEMRGIHASLGDLVNHELGDVPVESAVADATVGYASIDKVVADNMPDENLKVEFTEGTDGRISITGTYQSPLGSTQIQGDATVTIKDGDLVLELTQDSLQDVPATLRSSVASMLNRSYHLPELPFGFEAQDVTIGGEGVTVRATTSKVELG
ncbi:DUF2993 domain-containing protein [Kineosporia sp. J2-2]|uniref:DUF2993 domain-containing protein n=1 Tax=Kineosporia corallincola TaxID=2835133 RepID=A0ABS5TQI0_9ACTN|nr:DUF2993 domain-containing protein [Kineosporia corallincola]MBT0772649.1 DUF2993 domain-containing protein [Kineosporia corallincola]